MLKKLMEMNRASSVNIPNFMSWLPKPLENNSHLHLNGSFNIMTTSALTSQMMQTPESYKPLMNIMPNKDLKTAKGPVQ